MSDRCLVGRRHAGDPTLDVQLQESKHARAKGFQFAVNSRDNSSIARRIRWEMRQSPFSDVSGGLFGEVFQHWVVHAEVQFCEEVFWKDVIFVCLEWLIAKMYLFKGTGHLLITQNVC